jgi:hypothetical protein
MNMDGTTAPSQPPLPRLPPFELYMTPPRTLLDSQKSLQELGLVRAAKVYVSWKRPLPPPPPTPVPNNDNDNNNNNNGPGWYLRPALFLAASAGTAPALPTSAAVVAEERRARTKASKSTTDTTTTTTTTSTVAKRKKTKAEKEANLLKRMLGN